LTRGRGGALAVWLAGAAVALPGAAAAQSFEAQPQHYLLTVDAFDARALWLQPAGLSRRNEASVAGMLTADGSGTVSQYGATIGSGGLGLGWQHDRRIGTGTDVFSVGLGLGGPRGGLGADHRWYRGSGAKDGSWDIGARVSPTPLLELSVVWRDIGTPVYFVDTTAHTINTTLVPGAALNLFGRLHLAGEWELVTKGGGTSAYRFGAAALLSDQLALTVRGDFSAGFDARALAVSLTWSGPRSRMTGFVAALKGADDLYGAWLASVRDLSQRSRRSFR